MHRLWRTAWLLMLAPPLFWSGNFITGRAVRDAVPPVALAFWRWVGALAIALPLAWPHLQPRPARTAPALAGDADPVGHRRRRLQHHGLYRPALDHGAERRAAAIGDAAVHPAMGDGAVRHAARHGTRRSGICASMVGVAVIAGEGSPERLAALSLNAGDLWVLGAVASYAFYTALLRRRPPVHPLIPGGELRPRHAGAGAVLCLGAGGGAAHRPWAAGLRRDGLRGGVPVLPCLSRL